MKTTKTDEKQSFESMREECEATCCDSGEMDINVYSLSCGHVAYYPSVYEDMPSYCPECGARVI